MNGNAADEAQLLVRELPTSQGCRIGVVTLNAPRSLNALSRSMIQHLGEALQRWALDPQIACVVLAGTGERALCAGGDVRSLREAILAYTGPAPNPYARDYFAAEYRLDFQIHRFQKPLLVWGTGAVMGGGLGLMVGASHRVVTETSRLAMPEISIGLYPDVGASWFLQRLPERLGLFLALTGAVLNGADAIALGLADVLVASSRLPEVLEAMSAARWTGSSAENRSVLGTMLGSFKAEAVELELASEVEQHASLLKRVVRGADLEQVARQIQALKDQGSAWLATAAATFAAGSPTTAALIWAIWQRAAGLSLAEVLRMELVLSLSCCAYPDLAEGVRALLIDKDRKPHWQPGTLAAVSQERIAAYFAPPWADRVEPLLRDLA